MAQDAVDIKESLGALVMRPRAVKRTHDQVELCAKDDPGNTALEGELATAKQPAAEGDKR
jgi:hypothetical protein